MNTTTPSRALPEVLEAARRAARERGLTYAGDVTPAQAWDLVSRGEAVLVDVRSAEERSFVGRVPAGVHVPWATGLALTRNPDFLAQLEATVADKQTPMLLLCRSARRSVAAAEVATRAGYAYAFNILEGFEGDLDEHGQRGRLNGWRWRGLPWVQD
jgi:rhodanese-related sulfurtransferase